MRAQKVKLELFFDTSTQDCHWFAAKVSWQASVNKLRRVVAEDHHRNLNSS